MFSPFAGQIQLYLFRLQTCLLPSGPAAMMKQWWKTRLHNEALETQSSVCQCLEDTLDIISEPVVPYCSVFEVYVEDTLRQTAAPYMFSNQ